MKKIIWDKFGMILQTGDGGDTAANMGTYHIFCETRRRMKVMNLEEAWPTRWANREKADFEKALDKLHAPTKWPGLYRRHPDPLFWGGRWNTMSRDQTIPLLGAMALYNMRGRALEYIAGHFLRGFLFTTNTTANWTTPSETPAKFGWGFWKRLKFFFGWRPGFPVYTLKMPDFTDPEFWALEMRAVYHPVLWFIFFPLLCLFDFQTVVGSYAKVKSYAKDPSHSDDRNHVNLLLIGLQVCPTPVMKWAAKIYSKRPWAFVGSGIDLNRDKVSGPQSALDHYYRAEDSPPLNDLAKPIIERYF